MKLSAFDMYEKPCGGATKNGLVPPVLIRNSDEINHPAICWGSVQETSIWLSHFSSHKFWYEKNINSTIQKSICQTGLGGPFFIISKMVTTYHQICLIFFLMIPCRNMSYFLNVDHRMFLMLIIPFIPLSGCLSRLEKHSSGWWFGCHEFGIFPFLLGMSLVANWRSRIFFRGVAQPPTRYVYPLVNQHGYGKSTLLL